MIEKEKKKKEKRDERKILEEACYMYIKSLRRSVSKYLKSLKSPMKIAR